jgi:hypothetical protein
MKAKTLVLGALLISVPAAAVGSAVAWLLIEPSKPPPAPPPPPPPPQPVLPVDSPTAPIDAQRIQTGQLSMERMPPSVVGAIESHSVEIVKTQQLLASKQARITGTCAPGSAIRLVGEDGSVICQKLPRGVSSVAALTGVTRLSSTETAQASVPGGVGRYQTAGDDDFLVLSVNLPDGATVTGFSYTFWDDAPDVDVGAYLFRSDDVMMAKLATSGAAAEVRMVQTENIQAKRVDNSAYGYMVFMQLSTKAGKNVMPIAASVTYRLP